MDASVREFDLTMPDGRRIHGYDRPPAGSQTRQVVYWHHGSPNIGAPPEPLFELSDRLGIRWLGHDRPGYGGSTSRPGRSMVSVAADVAAVAEARGVGQFAVMGSSGGGPNALACAARLAQRVTAVVTVSSPAPFTGADFDPFAGMRDAGPLLAAVRGRAARERYEAETEPGEPPFIPADWAALNGAWSWLMDVVGPALASGPAPLIDDDLALVSPWGFELADVSAPVLLVHGAADGWVPPSHARRLGQLMPAAELRLAEAEGHVSVLNEAPAGLEWLARSSHGG